jgi:hypothetical protein
MSTNAIRALVSTADAMRLQHVDAGVGFIFVSFPALACIEREGGRRVWTYAAMGVSNDKPDGRQRGKTSVRSIEVRAKGVRAFALSSPVRSGIRRLPGLSKL